MKKADEAGSRANNLQIATAMGIPVASNEYRAESRVQQTFAPQVNVCTVR
jgi:hypothetical protein